MSNTSFMFNKKMLLSLMLSGFIFPLSTHSFGANGADTSKHKIEQQTNVIKGIVIDSKTKDPIIGANIFCKDKAIGSVTNFNGEFEINIPIGSHITISYVGYKTLNITLKTDNQTISLEEDSALLDEVVVVGYAVQKKESLTGSMQVIKSDKLKDVTSPSVENMLSSKAPGVYVASGSGRPGSSGAVMIRGKSTLGGNSNPLWVIDGVIMGSDPGQLNPADIESMSILKDAASTAIYGSQGANGVILITTKTPKTDKLSINFSSKIGMTRLNTGRLKMMDGSQLYDYYNSFENAQEFDKNPLWRPELRDQNFDWWKYATHTGVAQDYNISMSGGSEKLKGLFSAGYYDEDGAVKGYNYNRYTVRFKLDFRPIKYIRIQPNFSGSKTSTHDQQHSVTAMYSKLPWDSPFDKDGNIVDHRSKLWFNSNTTNYVKDLHLYDFHSNRYEFNAGVNLIADITDWLKFNSVNNYRWSDYKSDSYTDPRADGGKSVNGRLGYYNSNFIQKYANHYFTFQKNFNKHALTAIAGYEYSDYKYRATDVSGTGFVAGLTVLDVVALPEKTKGGISESARQSYFMKAMYDYDSRYIAEFSIRRDGASNFGDDSKYGNFYSISGGWNIHRENWFNISWINNLKLRASFGTVGTPPHLLYPQYDLYSASSAYSYNGDAGLLLSQIGNRKLTWEKSYNTGVGFDLGLFENRFRLGFDYYYKETDEMLFRVPVSAVTGITGIYKNIGKIRNQGVEFNIGGDIIQTKDFNWSMDLNLGSNKNRVKELFGTVNEIIVDDALNASGTAQKILKVGYDSDTFYVKEWAGVNSETGQPMWYKNNKNADGTLNKETTSNYNEAKLIEYKSSAPKVFGGLNTTFIWKNLDISANFGYSFGGLIYNYSRTEYDSDGAYTDRNQMKLKSGWSRWEKPGDKATHPQAMFGNRSNSNKVSSRYIESSNYIKLRSLTIGYNFELPQYYINNLRVFFTGENLLTFTPYSGVDPEIPIIDGKISSSTGPSVYPSVRKFMFGVNVSF